MLENLRAYLLPTPVKILASVALGAVLHVYIRDASVREAAGSNAAHIKNFWQTSLAQGLPYLETDNKILKFLTFFVVAYLAVWLFTLVFRVLDKAQLAAIKKLRQS